MSLTFSSCSVKTHQCAHTGSNSVISSGCLNGMLVFHTLSLSKRESSIKTKMKSQPLHQAKPNSLGQNVGSPMGNAFVAVLLPNTQSFP